jgi:tRNA-splicing ligase RtcB
MKSRKEAFDDAISATKAAMAEGIVPGGGLAMLRAIEAVEQEEVTCDGDERTGLRMLKGAMQAAINCALANRQVITHLTRQAFAEVLPQAKLPLLYDVSHNTCKVEDHVLDGRSCSLFVHRKGATRAFGPGHPTSLRSSRPLASPS